MRNAVLSILAAIVSGILLGVIVPPFNLGPLVWVALVPLIVVLWRPREKRAGLKAAGLGWIAGMISFGIHVHWLNEVSWLGALALPAYLALYPAAFAWFAATLGNPFCDGPEIEIRRWPIIRRSLGFAFRNAAVWAGLELLRGWVITGFGWNGLGIAFHQFPLMAQAADLLGVVGLSMLPAFVQFTLIQTARRMALTAHDGIRRTKLDFIFATLIVLLCAIYGVYRISSEKSREFIPLKSLLVQLNVPQEAARQLWDSPTIHIGYEDETLAGLEKYPDAQWVIWPEVAVTRPILSAGDGQWGTWQENQVTFDRIRANHDYQFLFGVNEIEAKPAPNGELAASPDSRMWNSLAVLDPDGNLERFRKHHLVIFGETIPLVDRFPWLKKIYEQQAGVSFHGSFTPGQSLDPLPVPAGDQTIGVIPSICFEDTVPRLTRKFVRPGPQVIVNVTNDGWFKESAAAAQHFANSRFRAIELRRPMLRCANSGVSGAIDTTGFVVHPVSGRPQLLLDENGSSFLRGSLLAESRIPIRPATTLYSLIGDWGVTLLGLGAFGISFLRRR
ncbi:MAG: apolipoprotein N-acyltransferase [Verrucomicrobiota bacterium]